ncbi:MAG: hypothetical protein CM15mP62_34200 [Rhodospirillaceae bacterium]|nr:MAG: hypothetical protein CM15mP62_34200 [Rhodospirillaceae bacterium]
MKLLKNFKNPNFFKIFLLDSPKNKNPHSRFFSPFHLLSRWGVVRGFSVLAIIHSQFGQIGHIRRIDYSFFPKFSNQKKFPKFYFVQLSKNNLYPPQASRFWLFPNSFPKFFKFLKPLVLLKPPWGVLTNLLEIARFANPKFILKNPQVLS